MLFLYRDAFQIATRNGYIVILKRLYKECGGSVGNGLLKLLTCRNHYSGDSLVHIGIYFTYYLYIILIYSACSYGNIEILKWFKDIGLNFKVLNLKGQSVVHSAAIRGQYFVLKYLYESRVQIDFRLLDSNNQTPFDIIPTRSDGIGSFDLCRQYLTDIYICLYDD